jgi:hypothetical protein
LAQVNYGNFQTIFSRRFVMKPSDLEKISDKSLNRLDSVAEKHLGGDMEDKTAHVQASVANATSRAIGTNINCRRQGMRETLATAAAQA